MILPFVITGTVALLAYFLPIAVVALKQTGQQVASNATQPITAGSPFTILLLGSDNDAKFQGNPLTQTMMLVRVNPQTKQVTMFSIPRDLYVHLSTGGYGKIDEAYELGGPTAAVQTVENDFDVQIDDWAWIGLTGLVKLVDTVGGIDISPTNAVLDDQYPNDIDTANPYSTSRVAVLPGGQHLGGTQVLEYVRSRHDDIREDFGRSFRQQQVLIALRAKARYVNVADLPTLVSSFQGEFKTSMGVEQMRELLPVAEKIQPGAINQVVLVGNYTSDGYAGGEEVLFPNWGLIQQKVHQSFPAPQ
ncbi:MAG TPA: LCP family protein [Candidatus Dormibacteraeota bacterium]|nr:LCP family protein [Candidatus Dormibacteraeota bacterium]